MNAPAWIPYEEVTSPNTMDTPPWIPYDELPSPNTLAPFITNHPPTPASHTVLPPISVLINSLDLRPTSAPQTPQPSSPSTLINPPTTPTSTSSTSTTNSSAPQHIYILTTLLTGPRMEAEHKTLNIYESLEDANDAALSVPSEIEYLEKPDVLENCEGGIDADGCVYWTMRDAYENGIFEFMVKVEKHTLVRSSVC